MPSAAVVGAGLSGLTAAHRLRQAGWDVTVLESEHAVGGRVRTVRERGYQVDTGASAISESYVPYLELARELGLELHACAPCVGIRRGGTTHLVRLDRKLRSGLGTGLLSRRAKLRAAALGLDVLRARARGRLDYEDMGASAPLDTESARSYALRRLGPELEAYLVTPIVRTMLIADADKVSRVELLSGVANIFASRILALAGGQGRMPELLAEGLDVRLGRTVARVVERGREVEVDGERFDACVVTCPLPVAAAICPDRASVLGPLDERLTYTRALTVAIGTSRPPDCPAFLVQLPSREDADVALMFLDHNKAPDRAPAGHGLISCCWETDAAARLLFAPDDEIVERTLASVLAVFGELAGTVEFTHVTRWPRALPLTAPGAYRAIGAFNAALDPGSRIQFAADYMSAAGQNTAVRFGERAAQRLVETVRSG